MFTLVTSNQDKIFFATKSLEKRKIPFVTKSINLTEIQTDSPEELILAKAQAAFDVLKKPVVVSDHWWSIEALGGFPGPYMHFMNDHLTAEDLIRLMGEKTNRKAILREYICYKDHNNTQTFSESVPGVVLDHPEGKGVPGQQVISLTDDGHSIAFHINQGTDPRGNAERKVWTDLADYLCKLQ